MLVLYKYNQTNVKNILQLKKKIVYLFYFTDICNGVGRAIISRK